MIPFPASPSSIDYADTTTAMLLGLEHGHPLVNGYSGFFPQRYIDLRKDMADFPSEQTITELRDLHVHDIVVDNAWLTDSHGPRCSDSVSHADPRSRAPTVRCTAFHRAEPGNSELLAWASG